jgi:hypothetical protein
MKITKKMAIFAAAVVVMFAGFFIDRKRGIMTCAMSQQKEKAPLIKNKEQLTIHNETGSKVNAAFYNKKLKRRGNVMRVDKEKMDVARRPQAPYVAVSRNVNTLGEQISKSIPRTNVRRTRCVTIKSKGQDLVITPTAVHKH